MRKFTTTVSFTFIRKILPWLWLAMVYFIYLVYINKYAVQHLDADMSSEMVLSKLLSKGGGILSEHWYYSTELRVFNIQLVISFFFRLFDNWHLVRMCSSAVLMLILLASFYYLCAQMGCRKYFPLAGSVLVMPFCADYYEFVMMGLYYFPHISISFASLGLLFQYGNSKKKRKQTVTLVLSFLLAFLATLGGARQILIIYLPVLIASAAGLALMLMNQRDSSETSKTQQILWKSRTMSCMICSMFFLAGSLLGFRVNSAFLAKRYSFKHYYGTKWIDFSWENVVGVFRGFLESFGYSQGYVMSGTTIRNGICFLIVTLLLWYLQKAVRYSKDNEQSFISLTLVTEMGCYLVLYTFTSMMYSRRYILPIIILAVPLLASVSKEIDERTDKEGKISGYSLCLCLVFFIFVSSIFQYRDMAKVNKTESLPDVVEALVEENYKTGYSTFWQANLVTELSDGKIDMYDWLDAGSPEDLKDVDTIYEWLQVKEHHNHPKGKVFLLFTPEEFRKYSLCKSLLSEDALIDTDKYLVFGFENYEEMAETFN